MYPPSLSDAYADACAQLGVLLADFSDVDGLFGCEGAYRKVAAAVKVRSDQSMKIYEDGV